MSIQFSRLLAGLAFTLAGTTGALAADEAVTVHRLVSTQGLNLASPADQTVLRHRIAVAARVVCHLSNPGEGGLSNEMTDCISTARQDAWAQAQVKIAAAEGRTQVAAK